MPFNCPLGARGTKNLVNWAAARKYVFGGQRGKIPPPLIIPRDFASVDLPREHLRYNLNIAIGIKGTDEAKKACKERERERWAATQHPILALAAVFIPTRREAENIFTKEPAQLEVIFTQTHFPRAKNVGQAVRGRGREREREREEEK
jgi:hypothetical protein